MIFKYQGKEWDTDKPNQLQITDDEGLKQAVIDQWFEGDDE